jgi:3-isopropylmalate dehydratase small subunit
MTVAASSFGMTITDPTLLLDDIDADRLQDILGTEWHVQSPLQYVEPPAKELPEEQVPSVLEPASVVSQTAVSLGLVSRRTISGKVQTLGDFIDTDALAPAEALFGNLSPEEMGKHCLIHTHPHFRGRVKEGLNIVVAGKAFGVGSSRDNAVSALMGTGVQCVIARSFAFIYARNQPNMGLLGIVIGDEAFYHVAVDGADITVLVEERSIKVGGREFGFTLSDLEVRLWEQGGMSAAFARWGKKMLEKVTASSKPSAVERTMDKVVEHEQLRW